MADLINCFSNYFFSYEILRQKPHKISQKLTVGVKKLKHHAIAGNQRSLQLQSPGFFDTIRGTKLASILVDF